VGPATVLYVEELLAPKGEKDLGSFSK